MLGSVGKNAVIEVPDDEEMGHVWNMALESFIDYFPR